MLHSARYRSEATAVVLGRDDRSVWRHRLLTLLATVFMTALATSHASAASDGENYRVFDDLAVYLGILPAAIARGHPKEHPETSMHDGATGGAHQYHMVVALFDARNGARIENAAVTATVSGVGHVGTKTIELQPMAIAATTTYGNFVTLLGTDRYDIQLHISVPGREHPVRVGLAYRHTR